MDENTYHYIGFLPSTGVQPKLLQSREQNKYGGARCGLAPEKERGGEKAREHQLPQTIEKKKKCRD